MILNVLYSKYNCNTKTISFRLTKAQYIFSFYLNFILNFQSPSNLSFISFPIGISSKVNTITWVEFELAYFKDAVQDNNHSATYGHLPPITKTIQVRQARHTRHCWRSKDEPIGDVLLWTPGYGQAKAGRPARTYIQQLCEDTGCSPEDLPKAMKYREKWRERVRDIRASGTTWWWWWWWAILEIILII